MQIRFSETRRFSDRHIAPSEAQIQAMLETIGVKNLEELISQTVPDNIRLRKNLDLPEGQGEHEFLKSFKTLAQKNKLYKSYLGLGYYPCHVPTVILRNILENPAWYTAYTPYQAEIAQGRMEMLINFQTMIMDLTGLEIANASLLDEGTAAAEAMALFQALRPANRKNAHKFFSF